MLPKFKTTASLIPGDIVCIVPEHWYLIISNCNLDGSMYNVGLLSVSAHPQLSIEKCYSSWAWTTLF